eukprot:357212-Chlamydomonas_euryale.AAC.1
MSRPVRKAVCSAPMHGAMAGPKLLLSAAKRRGASSGLDAVTNWIKGMVTSVTVTWVPQCNNRGPALNLHDVHLMAEIFRHGVAAWHFAKHERSDLHLSQRMVVLVRATA